MTDFELLQNSFVVVIDDIEEAPKYENNVTHIIGIDSRTRFLDNGEIEQTVILYLQEKK